MISLDHFRKYPAFANKSDEELTAIRTEMEALAKLAIGAYESEMVPKNLIRVFPNKDESAIMTEHG